MNEETTKRIKTELQRLNDLAYERNLNAELTKLYEDFGHWQAKSISGFELREKIHVFHQGPARELYTHYQGSSLNPIRVARAIIDEIIAESEVSEEVISVIAKQIQFLKGA